MASYRDAIEWIVDMDDIEWVKDERPIPSVTAVMVSHLWNKPVEKVTKDIILQQRRVYENRD